MSDKAVNHKVQAVLKLQVMEALRTKYAYPAFAYFEELRNSTGFDGNRSADVVALGLWPGRGLDLNGFEVKISRSDWLGELKKPEKSEVFIAECDFWWVVAPSGVVKKEEIPRPWGHLELRGQKLFTVKAAPNLKPSAISRPLLASLLNRAFKSAGETSRRELEVEYERGKNRALENLETNQQYAQNELDELKKQVGEFEKASGITLTRWGDGKQLGEAVDVLLRHQPQLIARAAERAAQMFREEAKDVEAFAARLKEILKPVGLTEGEGEKS